MENIKLIDVTPENATEHTLFCIKNLKDPGFKNKHQWFNKRYEEGLRMKILKDPSGNLTGFIEYIPANMAWRPVDAPGYMFIHCIMVYPSKYTHQGNGSLLINICEEDAEFGKLSGVCVMTSKGAWMADKQLFEKNGYYVVETKGRFDLLVKKFDENAPDPKLKDWLAQQAQYQGWHLIYADQCPWHDKSVHAIQKTAEANGISINVRKIQTAEEAKLAPSGFGVFSLIHDGKLLEDHYISETRFKNILTHELQVKK